MDDDDDDNVYQSRFRRMRNQLANTDYSVSGGGDNGECPVKPCNKNESNIESGFARNILEYTPGAIGATQIGMTEYRKAQPILSKIGTFSKFSSTYRFLGTAGRITGGAATYVAAPISVGLDYNAMQNGEIGLGRFAYRTTTVGTSVGVGASIGGPPGAVAGATVGALGMIGEFLYDGAMWWIDRMAEGTVNFNNAINDGWIPGQ